MIQECPADQAYDACLTNIEQKGELANHKTKCLNFVDFFTKLLKLSLNPAHGRLTVVKKCGLRPCSLNDVNSWVSPSSSQISFHTPCKRKVPTEGAFSSRCRLMNAKQSQTMTPTPAPHVAGILHAVAEDKPCCFYQLI